MLHGGQVSVYKDAVYADHSAASHLTGAVRVTAAGDALTMHVQLVPEHTPPPHLRTALQKALPPEARPTAIEVWPYARFPFGMTLDYERKFASRAP